MAETKKRHWFKTIKKILLWLFVAQFVYIIILRWVNPPFTVTQLVSLVKGQGLKRDYVSYNEMSANAKLAVMAGEDQLFPDHNGFDIKSIKLAMKYNKKHPNKIRGASTISQQVAKNVFLWQGGGFFRKGLEVYFTFMIETFWSKERILQMYLNVAEMGEGIYGIQAASKAYFNKDAINLTRGEAAQIAAALPNPVRFTVKPVSRFVAFRSANILRQMANLEPDPDVQQLIK
ncbi:monofunctional biosynthetic peptidoglycan transglycosylase [Ferruginibacter yonginensis]|uniref:Biosynthetic peptidoglycan transglycosylase n=1 Tax=Ferruginibacter yonginensis TaxID=1310416 RepID=A0ABV8QTK8_9BACT